MVCSYWLKRGKHTASDRAWTEALETADRIILVTAASAQARIDALTARVAELEAAKWEAQHVDTMNDMVAMGLARDAEKARADRLESALIEALPFVESCEYDNGYKPGAVLRVVKNIQSALQQEG